MESLLKLLELAKDDGHKLIFTFLAAKGYTTDALDKQLLTHRRHEAVSRRSGQSLQDFTATKNMSGVTIHDDRRAYHMLIRSGLTYCQINNVYGFVFDPDVPSLSFWKVQEVVINTL